VAVGLCPGRLTRADHAAGARAVLHQHPPPTFQAGHRCVLRLRMGRKRIRMVYRGGRTCHAAIVARELGIPAVGAEGATERLQDGEPVTVGCAEGDVGRVYAGMLRFHVDTRDLTGFERPATEAMVNLGNPELAFKTAMPPCDGVGLARMEFIINEYLEGHPMALLDPGRVSDPAERLKVQAVFRPRPVIVGLSDFKSNEYAALLGGRDFEPHEENPMLGFRGAARYVHPAYEAGFAMECHPTVCCIR